MADGEIEPIFYQLPAQGLYFSSLLVFESTNQLFLGNLFIFSAIFQRFWSLQGLAGESLVRFPNPLALGRASESENLTSESQGHSEYKNGRFKCIQKRNTGVAVIKRKCINGFVRHSFLATKAPWKSNVLKWTQGKDDIICDLKPI